ncbi:MAG: PKD domain-containing protein, partial [Thermoflexales bacterium]|nr:PKD domain-containing protein [Thermoflexales bacterium]
LTVTNACPSSGTASHWITVTGPVFTPTYSLAFAPSRSGTLIAGQSLTYTHWLTNTGNGTDEFSLSLSSSRGWATLIGELGPSELAAGASRTVQVQVTAPAGSETLQDVTVVTARAQHGGVSAAVTDTTGVACVDVSGVDFSFEPAEPATGEAITFTASLASGSQPAYTWDFGDGGLLQVGNPILYAYTSSGDYTVILTVTNLCPSAASASHAIHVTGVVVTPTYRVLFLPASDSRSVSSGTVVTYEHTLWNRGTVVDNYALGVSSSQGWASLAGPALVSLLPDETEAVHVRVTVPAGAGGLQDTTRVTATSQTRPSSFASVLDTTSVVYTAGLSLAPSYSRTLGPGAVTTYTHVLTNSGNGPDEFNLSLSSSLGWATLPDGTGPFELAAGASRQIHVRVSTPLLVASLVDTTILTATAQAGAMSAAVTDTTYLACEGVSGVSFDVVPAEPATGQAITFTGSVLQGSPPFTYTWNFGDGTPAQVSNPILHSYATPGAYPVTVTASNMCPSSGAASRVVTVTGNAITPVYGVELGPDDSQTLDPGALWVYVHTLTNTGNMADRYAVSLSSTQGWSRLLSASYVSLPAGASALVRVRVMVPAGAEGALSDVMTVTVVSQNDPAAQDSQVDVTTVRLSGNVSLVPNRALTVQAGSQAVYTHTLVNDYNAAQSFALAYVSSQGYGVTVEPAATASLAANGGTAQVTVRVNVPANALSGTVDSTRVTAVGSLAGQVAVTDTTTVTTITPVGTAPVAAFVPSSASVVVGQVVSFTNITTGTEPISYAWTFGDGESSTLVNPPHSYGAAGDYTVILTATNAYGQDTASATISVTEAGTAPVAGFVPSSASVTVGQVVSFTNTTAGTEPISYVWTFGDGGSSTLVNPTHSYGAADDYTVILTATNDYGQDTASATISVARVEYRIYLPVVLKNN